MKGHGMELQEKIENIQADIFDYEVQNISNNVVSIFTEVIEKKHVDPSNAQAMSALNQLMKQCLLAMQNKDYLLLADIMEYELKPMIGGGL